MPAVFYTNFTKSHIGRKIANAKNNTTAPSAMMRMGPIH